jgi:hypothetical protein
MSNYEDDESHSLFSDWYSDNADDLKDEFIKRNKDKFIDWCLCSREMVNDYTDDEWESFDKFRNEEFVEWKEEQK